MFPTIKSQSFFAISCVLAVAFSNSSAIAQDIENTRGVFDKSKSFSVRDAIEAAPATELRDTSNHKPIPLPQFKQVDRRPDDTAIVTFDLRTKVTDRLKPVETGQVDLEFDSSTAGSPARPMKVELETIPDETNNFFDPLSIVNDPSVFPWNRNVKLFFSNANGSFVCSGALIHPRYVLTAGHCVYDHDNNVGFADEMTVVPGYENGDAPFGSASAVQFTTLNGWVNNANFEFDVAIVELDRPLGSLVGWFGYGWNSNNSFYNGLGFNNPGYPAAAPFNGQFMYTRFGTFDSIFTEVFEHFNQSWGGQSGSGSYYIDNGDRFIHAVLSYGVGVTLTGQVRMTQNKFNTFQSVIAGTTPSSPDLYMLDMNASPGQIQAGDQFNSLSWIVHNSSSSSWSGTISFDIYASTNDFISTFDTYLQTRTWNGTLGPNQSMVLNANSNPPTIPSTLAAGDYYVGGIITTSDSNTSNNTTVADDTAMITVTPGAPSNDNWSGAINLGSLPAMTSGTNVGATTQADEQFVGPQEKTVWWYFNAPEDGTVTINTFGSDFDTILDIFTGQEFGFPNLMHVTGNDDSNGTLQSQVQFEVNQGQCYEVRVAGYNGDEGNIMLFADFEAASGCSTTFNNGHLTINGDNSPNTINVTLSGSIVDVSVDGCTEQFSNVTGVTVNSFGGNDNITTSFPGVVIFAGSGNDTVQVNGPGGSEIHGEDGDDILVGGTGQDAIYGGLGDDDINGRNGIDFIDGGSPPLVNGGQNILRGGPGIDTILGSDQADMIIAGEGHDIVNAFGGDDTIICGLGRDEVYGGTGNDFIAGGNGYDTLVGGPGNDEINGGNGQDTIDGGQGDDILRGNLSHDILNGGSGNDTLTGGEGNDELHGGPGTDTATDTGENGESGIEIHT